LDGFRMPDNNFVELQWIFRVLRRWWWVIVGCVLVTVVLAVIVISLLPPSYQSSALLLVNPSKNSTTNQYNDLIAGTQLALTYSQMLKDRPVLETVVTELGLKQSADDLADQISAEPVRNSQIIKLTVTDKKPERAALIANSLAEAFTKRVEELSAKRYSGTIKNAEKRMGDLQTQIKDLQAQIDTLRSQKVLKDVDLANKQTSLTALTTDYRSLQNSYQELQLAVGAETGKVYIVEQPQVQTNTLPGTYSASAVVSVGQAQSISGNGLADDRLALTYGNLLLKPPLLQGVINELGLTETTGELSNKITVDLVPGTQLIRFAVQDPDATKAQLITKSLVNAFVTQLKALISQPYSDRLESLQKQINDMDGTIRTTQTDAGSLSSEIAQMTADLDRLATDLTVLRGDYRDSMLSYQNIQTTAVEASDAVIVTEPAEPARTPSGNRMIYIVVAGILGLAVGTGGSFFLDYIDGKIRTGQDVRSTLDLVVVSTIGKIPSKEHELVMDTAPASGVAEDFRVLSNKIRMISENSSVKTLLFTSPAPSEGKSITVSNLAIGLSRMGLRIVLVDADMRLPRLHTLFGLAQDEGLSNSLSKGSINGALQATGIGELKVLTSGRIFNSNPAELLSAPDLPKLLEDLQVGADLVLIDCPPILAASDASILASKVDGVLIVLRAGYSESRSAKDAIETLRHADVNVVGVVLNSVPDRRITYHR
jgi:capsular exopolysaccharide synthesis family protein